MHQHFATLTDNQFLRLARRIWARLTYGDGYQPFGYDWRTLWSTKPGWAAVWTAVCEEGKRRGL